jgi:hypothetical protein
MLFCFKYYEYTNQFLVKIEILFIQNHSIDNHIPFLFPILSTKLLRRFSVHFVSIIEVLLSFLDTDFFPSSHHT